MPLSRNKVESRYFNRIAKLPYSLRLKDFEMAMQDIYDFFYDVNLGLIDRGLHRLDDMLRAAIMSGVLSDMLASSLAKHSRSLTVNLYHNGHPDLVVNGVYPDNKVKAGSEGVEIKTTCKAGGAVDTHGARDQWMCVFVYKVDNTTEPARDRQPMTITEIYIGHVTRDDFRKNQRGELGTRTAYLTQEWDRKVKEELDLQAQQVIVPVFERCQSWQGFHRHLKVVRVLFKPDTGIPHCFSCGKCRSCSTEWIENNTFSKRKHATNQCAQELLRL